MDKEPLPGCQGESTHYHFVVFAGVFVIFKKYINKMYFLFFFVMAGHLNNVKCHVFLRNMSED